MMKNINKRNIVLILLVIICVIAIFIAVYIQWFKGKSIEELREESEGKENNLSEYETLEKNFDSIFLNDIKKEQANLDSIIKIKEKKDYIYAKYQGNIEKENEYSINVNIPFININSELANKYNKEIEDIFVKKINDIGENPKNEIYTVDYTSNIKEDVLSLIIKSTLKQQGGTQRIIIKTYCFNIKDQTEINLEDILNNKNKNKDEIQEKIFQKIKQKQNEAIALEKLGYKIYKRDYTNEMYQIKNITDFYVSEEGYIYIIFAYGNNNNTGEIDIVII